MKNENHSINNPEIIMVTVDVVNSIEVKEKWNRFLSESENASFASLFDWKIIYEDVFGFKTFYLSIKEDEKIRGVLPLVLMKSPLIGRGSFLVSTPYLTQSGLCSNGSKYDTVPVINKLKEMLEDCRAKYVEIRQVVPYTSDLFFTRKDNFTFYLNLSSGVDGLWNGFSPKVRNQIRKAQKSGIEVITGNDRRFIKFFLFLLFATIQPSYLSCN